MAEIFRDIVCDREGGQRSPGHQELFADLDDLDQFCRVGVEVDHVRCFAGRLGPGVHCHRDIGLGKRGGIVGAVTGHGDHPPAGLVFPDQPQFALGSCLGKEIVHAGFGSNGCGGEPVVTGDHDGLDPHLPELGKPFLDPAFHDIF